MSRHFLFVSDAIQAFLLVLEKGTVGDVYNVGTSIEIPIVQLARELVRMVGLVKYVRHQSVSELKRFPLPPGKERD